MLVAALVGAVPTTTAIAMATELDQKVCSNGTREAPCSVKLNAESLELRLEPGLRLKARRLGRWRISHQDGITIRSCNARIDLGDEVVYGVLRISSSTGTSLIWPQQHIDIPALHWNPTAPPSKESHLDTSSRKPGHPSSAG